MNKTFNNAVIKKLQRFTISLAFIFLCSFHSQAKTIDVDSIIITLPNFDAYPDKIQDNFRGLKKLEDEEKARMLIVLIEELNNLDPNGALLLEKELIALLGDVENHLSKEFKKKAYIRAITGKATAYMRMGKFDVAETIFKDAIKYCEENNLSSGLAHATSLISYCYYAQGRYTEGLKKALRSLSISKTYGSLDGIAAASLHLSSNYIGLGQLDSALVYLVDSANIYDKQGTEKQRLDANLSLAVCYVSLEDFDNAELCAKKGLEIAKKEKYTIQEGMLLNILGAIGVRKENYSLAQDYLEKAIPILKQSNDLLNYCNALSNLGTVLTYQGNPSEGLNYNKKALKIIEPTGNALILAGIYNSMGTAYTKLGNYDQAVEVIKRSLNYSEQINNPDYVRQNYSLLAEAYNQKENYQEALKYNQLFYNKEKELFTTEKAKLSADAQERYESVKRQTQIDLQTVELKSKKQRITLLSVLAVILLLAIVLFIAVNRRLKKAEATIQVLYEEEKHRIKNNLLFAASIFGLQEQDIKNEETKRLMSGNRNRIEAMGLLHQKLFIDNKSSKFLNIKEYLEDLIKNISFTFDPKSQVQLSMNIAPLELDADQVMRIGLIINELITNSFKHVFQNAAAPKINITLAKDKRMKLIVEDNGNGLPVEEKMPKESFGLKMINLLVEQLQGQIKISNAPGARYEITFA